MLSQERRRVVAVSVCGFFVSGVRDVVPGWQVGQASISWPGMDGIRVRGTHVINNRSHQGPIGISSFLDHEYLHHSRIRRCGGGLCVG